MEGCILCNNLEKYWFMAINSSIALVCSETILSMISLSRSHLFFITWHTKSDLSLQYLYNVFFEICIDLAISFIVRLFIPYLRNSCSASDNIFAFFSVMRQIYKLWKQKMILLFPRFPFLVVVFKFIEEYSNTF